MDCPACSRSLSTITTGAVTVEACAQGCGGLWLDRLELRRLDEAHEGEAESLLDLPHDPTISVRPRPRRCPRCTENYPLRTRRFHPTIKVDIDECPGCGGHWLDLGELGRILGEAGSEAERHEEARQIFDEMFKKDLAKEAVENDSSMERLHRWFRKPRWLA